MRNKLITGLVLLSVLFVSAYAYQNVVLREKASTTDTQAFASTATDTTRTASIGDGNAAYINTYLGGGTGYVWIYVDGNIAGNWVEMLSDSIHTADSFGSQVLRSYEDSINVAATQIRLRRAVTVSSGTLTLGTNLNTW